MHVAFDAGGPEQTPILLRHRVEQFVQLFDANLIVAEKQPDGNYRFVAATPTKTAE